jgi:hypothetical protein
MSMSLSEISDSVSSGPHQPPAPRPTQAHLVFREAMCRHYKAERERSEACLGDIINILQNRTAQHSDVIDDILLRLTKHYA